jgi:hypothetical protein
MSFSQLEKRLSAAQQDLDRAIEALIALDPGSDYLEPLQSAAAVLGSISLDGLTAGDRAALDQRTRILASCAAQAEALFHSAGTLQFGALLTNTRATGGYTIDGTLDSTALNAFHIDG